MWCWVSDFTSLHPSVLQLLTVRTLGMLCVFLILLFCLGKRHQQEEKAITQYFVLLHNQEQFPQKVAE